MKRKIALTCIIIVAVLGVIYASLMMLSSQHDIRSDKDTVCVAKMPMSGSPRFVSLAPGLKFKIDTGSDVSSITEADLAKLEELGYKARRTYYPTFGRNGRGDKYVWWERYTVDLPFMKFKTQRDTATRARTVTYRNQLYNVIRNVDFVKAKTDFSVLGTDFLEKFKVEYRFNDDVIALYTDMPDGYEDYYELEASTSPDEALWLGNRYYLTFKVDRIPNRYFLDTGLMDISLKLPTEALSRTKRNLTDGVARSLRGEWPCKIDSGAWIEAGNRAGMYIAHYYDNDEEEYAVNPINMFYQDALIDFPGRRLYLRSMCRTPRSDDFADLW